MLRDSEERQQNEGYFPKQTRELGEDATLDG